MRDLNPFWLESAHRQGVSFELRPLDLKTQYVLQVSMMETGVPSWDGIKAASAFITGWKGLPVEFSPKALRDVLDGGADKDWLLWLMQIAGELYRRSLMSEEEAKN